MEQLPTLASAAPLRQGLVHWRTWPVLQQTQLAASAVRFSLAMRALTLLSVPLLAVLHPLGSPNLLALLLLGIAYEGYLVALAARGRHPLLGWTALLDVVFITACVVFRGGLFSDVYLLYVVVIMYLAIAYAWRGAVMAMALIFSCYVPTMAYLYFQYSRQLSMLGPGSMVVRLVYLSLVGLGIALVVWHFEKARAATEQTQMQLADRVRRLEVIQHMSGRLHSLTSVEAIGAAIAAETRDLIAYSSCRVHLWREGPEGVVLPLIGMYGSLSTPINVPPGVLDARLGEGITGWVAQHGEPVRLADSRRDPRTKHNSGTPWTPESLLAVPLCAGEQVKGVIVMGKVGVGQFSADDQQLLVILAAAAAVALENAESRASLAQQARTDPVTGLPHHAMFRLAVDQALEVAQRTGSEVTLALLDLDDFRSYNERLGIAGGDVCLHRVSGVLRDLAAAASAAAGDAAAGDAPGRMSLPPMSAYRIGGDEFALLFCGPCAAEVAAMPLTLRAVQSIAALYTDEPLARITVSAGLAIYPSDAPTRQELIALADVALYLVRQTGPNRLGRADARAHEALSLRGELDSLVQTGLAQAGSEKVVRHLVRGTMALQQHRQSGLADRLTTEALRALAAAIDAKDDYTRGHSERVAAIAAELAHFLACSSEEVTRIATAARVHDIGKIGVPDELLQKGQGLTAAERAQMARHPVVGAAILQPIHTLADVVPIVLHHHERMDGQGYPHGLRGEAIPLGARVLAVADALDAMVTDRPYRRGMSVAEALVELRRHSGTHFWKPAVEAAWALYSIDGPGLALQYAVVVKPSSEAVLTLPMLEKSVQATVCAAGSLCRAMAPEPVRATMPGG